MITENELTKWCLPQTCAVLANDVSAVIITASWPCLEAQITDHAFPIMLVFLVRWAFGFTWQCTVTNGGQIYKHLET